MKKMILRILSIVIFFVLLICQSSYSSEYDDYIKELNIPTWVRNSFNKTALIKKYDYSFKLNPLYLRGDFNGDNNPDIAIMVKEKSTNKLGIIVIHFGSHNAFILGAGKPIGNGGDNFRWMSNWNVQRKGKVVQGVDPKAPPFLKVEAIHVEKAESSSGIIYWNGKEYVWYQQGD